MFDELSKLGELCVVVEPDAAHNTHSRTLKMIDPSLQFFCTKQSRAQWEDAGDASHVDGCFDDPNDEKTREVMQSFGFIEHIR